MGVLLAGLLLMQACARKPARLDTVISARGPSTYILHYPSRAVTLVYPPCAFYRAGVSPEAYLMYRASCVPGGYGAWQEDLASGRIAITTDSAMGWGILTVSWSGADRSVPDPVKRYISEPRCPTSSAELLRRWRSRKTDIALELAKRLFLPGSFPKSWGTFPDSGILFRLRRKLDSLVSLYIVPGGTKLALPDNFQGSEARGWCVSPWVDLAPRYKHDGSDIVLPAFPEHEPSVICARRYDGLHHSHASSVCRSILTAMGSTHHSAGSDVGVAPARSRMTTMCRIVQGPPDLVVVKIQGVADTSLWAGIAKKVLMSLEITVNVVPDDPVWQFTHAAGPWGTGSLPVSGGAVRCIIMGSTAPSVQSAGNGVN